MSAPVVRSLVYSPKSLVNLNEAQRAALQDLMKAWEGGEIAMNPRACVSGCFPQDATLIACKDRYGLQISTYLCPNSGLLWTSPNFDESGAEVFYRDIYRRLYSGDETPSDSFFERQVGHGRQIQGYLGRRAGEIQRGSIAEIGCGAGGLLLPFAQSGWRATGCDYGERYVERGRKEGLDLEVGNSSSIANRAPFDILMASHVLEHTLNPIQELRNWAELVREGGYLYIEVPGTLRAFDDYRSFGRFIHIAHAYHFTLTSLTALANQVGLNLIAGDESLRALFRKEPVEHPAQAHLEADKILRYLEYWQHPGRIAWQRIRRPLLKLRRKLKPSAKRQNS